eukprot:14140057-Alexandrium_andersonii.AAC.1
MRRADDLLAALAVLPVGAATSLTLGGKGTRQQGHGARGHRTIRAAASMRKPEAGCTIRALRRTDPVVAPGQIRSPDGTAQHDEAPACPSFRRYHRWPPDPQGQGVVPRGIDRIGSSQVVMISAPPKEVSEGRWLRHPAAAVGEVWVGVRFQLVLHLFVWTTVISGCKAQE